MARTNQRAVRWLRGELPALVSSGAITADNAQAIERYYAPTATASRGLGFAILAMLGSALVAAGVVLLVAHNWDEFSRATRSAIALLPLIAAQALCVFVLMRRPESKPWRESAAIFNVMGVGVAISLVSQIYQIHGTFANFILTWMLLSLPLVYLLRTTLGAVTYVIGAVVWAFSGPSHFYHSRNPELFWLLLLLVLPYAAMLYRRDRASGEMTFIAIVIAIAGAIGLGFTTEWADAHIGVIAFAGYFTAVYLCGMEFFPRRDRDRLPPLALLAAVAIGVMSIVLTFRELWHVPIDGSPQEFSRVTGVAIELLFPIAAIALAIWLLVRNRRIGASILAAAFPLAVLAAWCLARLNNAPSFLSSTDCTLFAALLLNVYALALGIELLARGMRANSLARANFGLLEICALAAARFFDSDLSFVTRGVGFIVIGMGFLAMNVVLFKRRSAS
jgi:uncharacterized membrane protein